MSIDECQLSHLLEPGALPFSYEIYQYQSTNRSPLRAKLIESTYDQNLPGRSWHKSDHSRIIAAIVIKAAFLFKYFQIIGLPASHMTA